MNSYCHVESPIGRLHLWAAGNELCGLYMGSSPKMSNEEICRAGDEQPVLHEAARQLRQYFAGTRRAFELPLRLKGTAFQLQVWRALTEIPFGVTWSYGQLARHIGNPAGCRAVGLANGRNPLAIIVPCHRVIGSNGSLTGFGGGLPRKQWLLTHEGAYQPRPAIRQNEMHFGAGS